MKFSLIGLLMAATAFSQVDGPVGGAILGDEQPGPRQPPLLSPPAQTSVTTNRQKITIKYSAPSMRKRVIFGGLEPYQRVWRAGANDATLLQTGSDLEINGLRVPKGQYSLYVWLDPRQWQLILNKQTGQSGLEYHQDRDVGRVPMTMSRSPKPIERFKITLTKTAPTRGQLTLAWENTVATVDFIVPSAP
jgi:Protein of unknown function (DUF2911)